ncbi:hypothetical protein GM415_02035 [Pseudodesulfovibrio cashew]|uniref:GerMN domain-containing protein n=1 Tax=Pseudodesulfovibrio cashew TaxID=2678688 RepID=A0A6I6JMP6_9BACT|nr:hypothetical protein [Pseudodesulfovibrio cashew]QGY38964.1 hypothetical protein GM415_02035 [Pseudodesulfovibrio cashew]
MRKIFVLLALALLLLPGCVAGKKVTPVQPATRVAPKQPAARVTPEQSAARITSAHLAQMEVTPVTTPTVYRYGPARGTARMTLKSESNGNSETSIFIMKYSVSKVGDSLLWHIFIPEWTSEGEHVKPMVPLVDITMDTDDRGVVGETKTTYPLFEALRITDPKVLASLNRTAENIKRLVYPLPEGAISNGDVMINAQPNLSLEALGPIKGAVQSRLEGEFSSDGKRYVAIASANRLSTSLKGEDIPLYFDTTGRTILAKDNMDALYSEAQVVCRDALANELATTKIIFEKISDDLN